MCVYKEGAKGKRIYRKEQREESKIFFFAIWYIWRRKNCTSLDDAIRVSVLSDAGIKKRRKNDLAQVNQSNDSFTHKLQRERERESKKTHQQTFHLFIYLDHFSFWKYIWQPHHISQMARSKK